MIRIRPVGLRFASILLGAGGLLAPAVLLTSPSLAAPPAPEVAISGPAMLNPLGELPDAVNRVGFGSFASTYGGLVAVNNASHLNVYLTSLAPAAEAALSAVAPAGTLSFLKTPRSWNDLNDVLNQIDQSYGSLRSQGVHPSYWYVDIPTGKVVVEAIDATNQDVSVLSNMFGDMVRVVPVSAADAPRDAADREHDSAPWNGSDSIYNPNSGGGCTSGVGIHYQGSTAQLTAAHCYPLNATIHNGLWNGYDLIGTNNSVGVTVAQSRDATSGTDTEVIDSNGGASDLLWTGSVGNPQRSLVADSGSNTAGYFVCTDGAYDSENCNVKIDSTGGHESGDYNTWNGPVSIIWHSVVSASDASGGIAAGDGDSGGPVVRFNSSGMLVVGIISQIGQFKPCVDNNFKDRRTGAALRDCGSLVRYSGMVGVLNQWNTTVVSG